MEEKTIPLASTRQLGQSEQDSQAPYDAVSNAYDVTRRPDPRLADAILERLRPDHGKTYLDLGCGTGNYLAEFAARGYAMIGLDLSQGMLRVAQEKSRNSEFICAPAEKMPMADASVAGAFSCLAVHHFNDLEAMAGEVYRVLEPGARFVIFTTDPSQTRTFWLNEYFGELMRSSESLMPSVTRLVTVLQRVGFRPVKVSTWDIPENMVDLFLYGAKHQPALYLHDEVRQGITRFRRAGQSRMVQEGCRRLEEDIRSGRFRKVLDQHPSACGDYTFITGCKAAARSE
ncbi:class I SAM-dependent methyltransferase (plasmid) [Bradyrhizobium sp. 62B]|uniref:class I SAM-dependent methyltransferase n=1 Tax=Bradyrhizobium sp. 62B TaxID=2898442 RepID=UPI002557EA1A|nr:class I SAM-dependent methyltransferase [Bradyrhizobium sp. 62B]